ncbi:uncharacterized protein [Primulina eburnea]|uniref:uncharacterized protein n=1 Tax=Primulina eburnea TaxID=1245227 RepID=UPI003C6CB844
MLDVSQLKSTPTTYVILNPQCSRSIELTEWLHATDTIHGVNELWTKKMFAEAVEVTLEQLSKKRNTLTENNYYCVEGRIKKLENNSSLFYDACNHCNKSATKTTSGMSCLDCTNMPIEIVPRWNWHRKNNYVWRNCYNVHWLSC